jgi:NADH dehydrogenase/NADH:ubiquinone oxidoreductase subunit G
MDNKIALTIDGREVEALPGQTILDVARKQGIFIPTSVPGLYHQSRGLRVCVVEVEGARSLVASCCMPINPGMVIKTDTPKVRAAQRMIVELLWRRGSQLSDL